MKLKYVGPKEIITASGISFKSGKDDKYTYIFPALQIYKAIHHDYEKNILYTHNIDIKKLTDEDLLNTILSIKKEFKKNFEEEIQEVEIYLDTEIERADHHKEYKNDEKKIYKNNLIIMKSYQMQREFNKIVYENLICVIVDDIIIHKIKEISAPFNERFWHLFQTIQGELSNHHKRSINSTIELIQKEELDIKITIKSTP